MAGPKIADRVKDTTVTTGTGTLTLDASPPTGYRAFGSVLSSGDTVIYTIEHQTLGEWEVGIGTYTSSGTTLSRDTILSSSNSGSATNFSSGTKNVFIAPVTDLIGRLYSTSAAYSSLASYLAGRLLLPTDGLAIHRDSGSALEHWGPIWKLTPPSSGSFSWVNQGSATLTADHKGFILLETPSSGADDLHIRIKSAPSTPYTITTAWLPNLYPGNYSMCGLVWRDSASSKLQSHMIVRSNTAASTLGIQVSRYSGPTGYLSNDAFVDAATLCLGGGPVWLRIADDGSNRAASISADGYTWHTVWSGTRTTHLTPDQVGFFVNGNTVAAAGTLLHWRET